MSLAIRRRAGREHLTLVAPPAVAPPPPEADLPLSWTWFAAGTAALFGVLVRATFVLSGDFPLNDGGMFYQMALDVRDAGYALPATTGYNGLDVAYAYPPLGFYAAALFGDLTPFSTLDAFRALPLLASALTIGAFAALARPLLPTRMALAAAVFAFALNPRSFEWMIMGGGITRSFGLLFALLAIAAAVRLCRAPNWRWAGLMGVTGALAVLSHLEMAWFMTFSVALVFALGGRRREVFVRGAAAGAIAAALCAPWWGAVLGRHGIDPFVSAATSSGPSRVSPIVQFLLFNPTEEPLFPLIAALGVLGAAAAIARREYLLPAWVVACAFLDPRAFGTVAAAPLALLAGSAFATTVVPLLRGSGDARRSVAVPVTVASVCVLYAMLGSLLAGARILVPLDSGERAAMTWIAANTPSDARLLVVTGTQWEVDRTSEWAPVLAGRVSAATVQGTEWLGGAAFRERIDAYDELQLCAFATSACIDEWVTRHGQAFDYVLLPRVRPAAQSSVLPDDECCPGLRPSLAADDGYRLVFDNESISVFERVR